MSVEPIRITSLDDERVEVFRDVRDKDLRGRSRLFMAESEMVLRRLLRTPERLHSVLVSPHEYEKLEDVLVAADESWGPLPVYVADIELMTQIAGFHIHRGVLAAGLRPCANELTLDAALGPLRGREELKLVLAEGLTNVDNIGGLFRNAAGFGIDAIVLDPTCCDPLYRKAIRVSMGHVLSLPYAVCENWPGDLQRLKAEWGITLIGAEVTDQSAPLWRMRCDKRIGIVFGSERHGLSEQTLAACDAVCEIPMNAAVDSINVSVASAVFMYEAVRGKGRRDEGP